MKSQVRTEWGVEGEGERGRERELHINGVREGLDRNRNGVGQKWPLEKLNTRVFLLTQINTINKLPIKLGGFLILQFLWCRNIRSHNAMFCHRYPISMLSIHRWLFNSTDTKFEIPSAESRCKGYKTFYSRKLQIFTIS